MSSPSCGIQGWTGQYPVSGSDLVLSDNINSPFRKYSFLQKKQMAQIIPIPFLCRLMSGQMKEGLGLLRLYDCGKKKVLEFWDVVSLLFLDILGQYSSSLLQIHPVVSWSLPYIPWESVVKISGISELVVKQLSKDDIKN